MGGVLEKSFTSTSRSAMEFIEDTFQQDFLQTFEDLDVTELITWLNEQKFPKEILGALKKNDINGDSFMKLTPDNLDRMKQETLIVFKKKVKDQQKFSEFLDEEYRRLEILIEMIKKQKKLMEVAGL